jgi:small subunit ribosomal protein S1
MTGMEDFAAALESFDREQAAEAATQNFDDNIVTGTVIKLTDKHVVIDVGLKSEGLIPIEQVLDHTGQPKLKAGDTVDVVIEREEAEGGYLVSYDKAQRLRVWDTIEKAANEKTPVMGTVLGRVKGGLTVDIGIKAFLPGSQLEIRPVRNLDGYIGQQLEVRVIKLNKKRGNVVVSRKEILEEEQTARRSTTLEHLEEGTILTGTVKNLTDYGAFVDFGAFIEIEDGIDGLVHVSNLSWTKRVKHPSEVLKKGEKVRAVVLGVEPENRRLSLGVKQLQPDVWETFFEQHRVGDVVKGKVLRTAQFGAFIEIAEGIEGLCHVSEAADSHGAPVKLEAGQEFDFKIIKMNAEEKKVGLSLRAVGEEASRADVEAYKQPTSSSSSSSSSSSTTTLGDLMNWKRSEHEN